MDDEKLIEPVHWYSVLYASTDTAYRNADKKEAVITVVYKHHFVDIHLNVSMMRITHVDVCACTFMCMTFFRPLKIVM